MKSGKYKVALLFGGNLGNTEDIFEEALRLLEQRLEIIKTSSLYITEAWGMMNAPDFLNQAVLAATDYNPQAVLKLSSQIEELLGRSRIQKHTEGYASRNLDIDILLYNNRIVDEENLKIPHPRMHLRNFCLVPLNEIAPEWVHPIFKESIAELLQKTPDQLAVRTK